MFFQFSVSEHHEQQHSVLSCIVLHRSNLHRCRMLPELSSVYSGSLGRIWLTFGALVFGQSTYCNQAQIWQCTNLTATACNVVNLLNGSTVFSLPAPTNLVSRSSIPSIEPTTTQSQFIPTVWGQPSSVATTTVSSAGSSQATSTIISSSGTTPPLGVLVGVPVGVCSLVAAVIAFIWWNRKRRGRKSSNRASRRENAELSPSTARLELEGRDQAAEVPVWEPAHELQTLQRPGELGAHQKNLVGYEFPPPYIPPKT